MSKLDPMDLVQDKPITNNEEEEDDDPITASYPVFLNPALPLGRRLVVLQHPNRTDEAPRPPPTEMRLKAQAGMVEVDVPLDNTTAYDREKGLRWGRTLQSSMAVKNGGTHGLAGGFGVGAVQQRGPGKKRGEVEEDDILDWNEAVRQDKVLRTQTLGGQYPDADEVQYMVGVFQGKDLHLTPVSSLVHLRPQLHHIDATTELERRTAAANSKETAPTPATAARAIHMSVKATAEGDGAAAETMADRLRLVQSEPWRKMRYTDENEEAAWDIYNESLFLQPKQDGDGPSDTAEGDLEDLVPRFGTKWGDKHFLTAVSGITKPEPVPVPEIKAELVAQQQQQQQQQQQTEADAARNSKARPRGGAAASLAARRGRAKAAGSRTAPSSIDVD